MFNKKQIKMLTQFSDRVKHAPEVGGGKVCRWAVVSYVDGERQEVDRVFDLRHKAEEYVQEVYRRNDVAESNEVELRVELFDAR
jgi:hypothetical protein